MEIAPRMNPESDRETPMSWSDKRSPYRGPGLLAE
jgi:hypothetical protein